MTSYQKYIVTKNLIIWRLCRQLESKRRFVVEAFNSGGLLFQVLVATDRCGREGHKVSQFCFKQKILEKIPCSFSMLPDSKTLKLYCGITVMLPRYHS